MMSEFQFDIVNVIDLEATCWENGTAGMQCDIIEVGVVELDVATGVIGRKTSMIVKPERGDVSKYCTKITGITPAQAAAGIPIDIACLRLRKEFAGRERVWASWGDFDRAQLERQCSEYGVPYPLSRAHINLLALANTKWRRRFDSISDALALIGEKFEGRLHSGADDAFNEAKVLRRILCVDTDIRFAQITSRIRQAFSSLTEEESNSLIDEALASVRARKHETRS
jgi:inhibitor of KinA sporulation pathway (predicted exonuclease)